MLPAFDPSTSYLPPGVHQASWCETTARFGTNSHRLRLLGGLLAALRILANAGCQAVVLDGSFISEKDLPEDYDACWYTNGVDPSLIDPVLLDPSNARAAMKSKYLGELFPASALATPSQAYIDFFMTDRNGVPKGVVQINLRSLP